MNAEHTSHCDEIKEASLRSRKSRAPKTRRRGQRLRNRVRVLSRRTRDTIAQYEQLSHPYLHLQDFREQRRSLLFQLFRDDYRRDRLQKKLEALRAGNVSYQAEERHTYVPRPPVPLFHSFRRKVHNCQCLDTVDSLLEELEYEE